MVQKMEKGQKRKKHLFKFIWWAESCKILEKVYILERLRYTKLQNMFGTKLALKVFLPEESVITSYCKSIEWPACIIKSTL